MTALDAALALARKVAECSASVRFQEDLLRMGVMPYDQIPQQQEALDKSYEELWGLLEELERALGIDPYAPKEGDGRDG